MSACLGKCEVGSLCPICDPTKVLLVKEADLLNAFYAAQRGAAMEAEKRLKAILEERPFTVEAKEEPCPYKGAHDPFPCAPKCWTNFGKQPPSSFQGRSVPK